MNKLMSVAVLCCALAPLSAAYGQGMMGATMHLTEFYPNLGTPVFDGDYLVTNGVEVQNWLGTSVNYNLTDSQFIMTMTDPNVSFISPVDFNGPHWFDNTNNLPSITNVTVDPATNWAGFDASRVHWDSEGFWVDVQGLAGGEGNQIVLNIVTPTPGAAALLSVAGLASARRRRV